MHFVLLTVAVYKVLLVYGKAFSKLADQHLLRGLWIERQWGRGGGHNWGIKARGGEDSKKWGHYAYQPEMNFIVPGLLMSLMSCQDSSINTSITEKIIEEFLGKYKVFIECIWNKNTGK